MGTGLNMSNSSIRTLDQNNPRFRRMRCDCCDQPVAFVVGTFPFYVCDAHRDETDAVQRALYEQKHGVKL